MKFGLKQYTLDAFWDQVVRTYGDRPSICNFGSDPISFEEMDEKVKEYREMLLSRGIGKGDMVAIITTTTSLWAIAYMAVMTLGIVAVPVMEEFPADDINSILERTRVKGIFTDSKIFAKLSDTVKNRLQLAVDLPGGKYLVDKPAIRREREALQEEDLAEILFTSGTTGHSKGVMLSHGNLVSNLFEGPDMVGCIHSGSRTLSLLPMAHAFGSTSAFLSIIYRGSAVYFIGRKPTPRVMMQALKEVKPTIIGGVPLIFEKVYAKKVAPLMQKSRILRVLTARTWGRRLFYRLIGKKMREAFGGHMDCAIIGGAPLAADVEEFLEVVKIPTVLGYGMTEAAPLITFASRETARKGAVGQAISDEEIRIVDPDPKTGVGEVWVKGPNVMQGYFEDPEETAKVLTEDGWLITGDRGYLDDDGFLYLKGRSKNVIIGPSGENIYPEVIESVFSSYVPVEEVLVLAQKGGQLIARIFPNEDFFKDLAKKGEDLAHEIQRILEEVRTEVNAKLPPHSRISKVRLEDSPFIKTVSNKIKRSLYLLEGGQEIG